jgi:uncharacterized protein (DUF342 family)
MACHKKVVAGSKRATIVGGRIRAAEEIRAKTLGSVAVLRRYSSWLRPEEQATLLDIEGKISEIDRIWTRESQYRDFGEFQRARKELPEDKEKYYEELEAHRPIWSQTRQGFPRKAKIEAYLSS